LRQIDFSLPDAKETYELIKSKKAKVLKPFRGQLDLFHKVVLETGEKLNDSIKEAKKELSSAKKRMETIKKGLSLYDIHSVCTFTLRDSEEEEEVKRFVIEGAEEHEEEEQEDDDKEEEDDVEEEGQCKNPITMFIKFIRLHDAPEIAEEPTTEDHQIAFKEEGCLTYEAAMEQSFGGEIFENGRPPAQQKKRTREKESTEEEPEAKKVAVQCAAEVLTELRGRD
jgi:hypothetical protein